MIPQEIYAHLNSLNGKKVKVTLLGNAYIFGNKVQNQFVFNAGNCLCTGIFNSIVCEYYVDDKYGIITPDDENYAKYKRYIEQ